MKRIVNYVLLSLVIGIIEYIVFLQLIKSNYYGVIIITCAALLPYAITINILLLIERNKLTHTEEFKRKRVAKLQDKIDNIKKN